MAQPASSSSSQPGSSQQQQQQRIRKPPFADWPTIKILTPPQGRFSPKIDEWCFTFATQTVSGRIHERESNCRTICVRKVFPHEVRNIIAFKRHSKVDGEGKANYPLPAEGQPANLPRLLGGKVPEAEEDEDDSAPRRPAPQTAAETKNWQEGWYLWTSGSRKAALERLQLMSLDLDKQQRYRQHQEQRQEVWAEYQEKLRKGTNKDLLATQYTEQGTHIRPPLVSEADRAKSLLLRLPPDLPPIWERINKLLAPSHRALTILKESIVSGEQRDFALRVWEKAQTNEPFVLAQRTVSRAYERWKERPAEDDDRKNSP